MSKGGSEDQVVIRKGERVDAPSSQSSAEEVVVEGELPQVTGDYIGDEVKQEGRAGVALQRSA